MIIGGCRRREEEARAREDSWDRGLNHACWHSRKSEYNALYDTNMRHFFENEHLQLHLYRAGLVCMQSYGAMRIDQFIDRSPDAILG